MLRGRRVNHLHNSETRRFAVEDVEKDRRSVQEVLNVWEHFNQIQKVTEVCLLCLWYRDPDQLTACRRLVEGSPCV